jgi:hypothetical protein
MRILTLIVFAILGFVISRLLITEKQTNVPQPQSHIAESASPSAAATSRPHNNNTPENREKALAGISNLLRGKGANIIDKRAFDDFSSCDAAMTKVVGEYQRRGISSNNVMDGTAFLGAPGKAVAMLHGEMAYYVTCLDFSDYDWAGYLHYSLTTDQVEALSKQGP